MILKFTQKSQETRRVTTISKPKTVIFIVNDRRFYYKVTVKHDGMAVARGEKPHQWKRIELSEIDTDVHHQVMFDKLSNE